MARGAQMKDVDGLVAEVAARWPGLRIERDVLAAALAERGVAPDAPVAVDVALACALAAHDPRALDVFERELVADVRGALVRLDHSGDLVDEALQQVREKLLVSAGRPRITEYRARGPLSAWIQIVAIREALMLKRKVRNERATEDPLLLVVDTDPALALTKRAYRAEFAAAFRDALAALGARDRTLLRLCFVDGIGTERLAKLYEVHRVTMFRWMCDARANLLDAIRERLSSSAGIAPEDVDSLIRAVASSFDVSW